MIDLKKVIFIGGNRFNESGPLIKFYEICKSRDIPVKVFTDIERYNYPVSTGISFGKALAKFEIEHEIIDHISEIDFDEYSDDNTLIFLVNCKWILKHDVIKLFPNRIFNYHASSLPEQRGAACHSWRLMQDNKKTALSIHEVIPQIDKGRIFIQKKIEKTCKNLQEFYKSIEKHESSLFSDFIDGKHEIKIQDEDNSYYWPKLNTEINGFINWNWTAKEIVSFCSAFDKPFNGASTFIKNIKIQLTDVSYIHEKPFHPFQYGLIYRITHSGYHIACREGGIVAKNIVLNKDIRIKLGMRFVTPPETLLSALTNNNK